MKYRTVGKTGLTVSELCLGCQTFGDQVNVSDSARMVDLALDAGVNFFDVADVYNEGRSEELLGTALKGKRSAAIIATKVYGKYSDQPNRKGLSRYHILEGVESSLKRLSTDYLDLYQMHAPDYATAIDDTLWTMDNLVRQGKVRYVGCSNFAAWQICRALWVSEVKGLVPIDCTQIMYNLLARRAEQELFPFCTFHNIAVTVYNPLAGGLLTGKHRHGKTVSEKTRFTSDTSFGMSTYHSRYWNETNFAVIDEFAALAEREEKTLAEVALGWILANPVVVSVIVGATSAQQLKHNLDSLDWRPSQTDAELADSIWARLCGVAPQYNRLHYKSKYLGQVGPAD